MTPTDAPLPDLRGLRVAVINPYLEGREAQCNQNLYPRSHLWGADVLARAGATVEFVRPDPDSRTTRWLAGIARITKWRVGNLDYDWAVVRQLSRFDLVYAATGRLLLLQSLRALRLCRAPVAYWNYLPPRPSSLLKLHALWERRPFCFGIDGMLCLTEAAAAGYRRKWPSVAIRHIDWGADPIMFPGSDQAGEFFFACGRTNRDYATLLAAAAKVEAPFVILVSRELLRGLEIPSNVRIVEGPKDAGTDKGISYPELISEYYSKAKAVLICRRDIPGDTSGLTNLLEALAMGRPVAITRTGALDIDVEAEGVGAFVGPGDAEGWAALLNGWLRDPAILAGMQKRARQVVVTHYNHERHGRDVATFLRELLP